MFEQTEAQRQAAFSAAGQKPYVQSPLDQSLQRIADVNPEFADSAMDKLGYTSTPLNSLNVPGTSLAAQPDGTIAPSTKAPLQAPTGVLPVTALRDNPVTGSAIANFLKTFEAQQQQASALATPTQEESDLSTKLRNLETTEMKELNNSENRLAPIFAITGEQANIRRNAALEKQVTANSLQALTQQRTAKLNALEKSIGLNKDILSFAVTLAGLEKPDSQVITNTDAEGNVTAVTIDKKTGNIINEQQLGNVGKPTKESVNNQVVTETDANGNVSIITVDKSTGEIVAQQTLRGAGKPQKEEKPDAGFVITPQESMKMTTDLRKEFNALPEVKEFNSVNSNYAAVTSAYQQALAAGKDGKSKAAADQVLVTSFNKMIDPGSVVKEGEFARSTAGQSLINRLKGKADAALKGGVGLSDADRKSIVDATQTLFNDYKILYNSKAQEYRGYVQDFQGDPNKVAKVQPVEERKVLTDEEAYQEYLKSQQAASGNTAQSNSSLFGRIKSFFGKGK